ncbi:MAG TPA: ATP-binding protein [Candidatus Deferrimicrobium sp.]|nr:ATP-binding protein [Candidatus Deferrimicrobium sp.]
MQKKEELNIIKPIDNPYSKNTVFGQEYLAILEKVQKIIYYQQKYKIKDGIKGFIFFGEVGTGKTTIAKVLANVLNFTYIFVDGSDIARSLYGESERQIAEIFKKAENYGRVIIIIDDCESVFPTRDWIKGESWHIAQNNVFFHCLDNVDTSKISVILTTNRFELIDKAVKDRLYPIEFPFPTKETLKIIAENKCKQLQMDADQMISQIDKGDFKTIREIEKLITEQYIDTILSKEL